MAVSLLSNEKLVQEHVKSLTSLLLDFDGTLVDYYKNEEKALGAVLGSYGVASDSIPQMIPRYRVINERLWKQYEQSEVTVDQVRLQRFQQLSNEFGLDTDPVKMNAEYLDNFQKTVVPYDGIVERLQQFRQDHPEIDLIILTNGFHDTQTKRAKHTGLDKVTDGLVSSDQVGWAKPAVQIFEHTRDIFDLDLETTLVIGDSLSSDIAGAKNMNLRSCLITPNGETSEFIPVPDLVASSCHDILDFITTIRS